MALVKGKLNGIGMFCLALILIAKVNYGQGSRLAKEKISNTNDVKELSVGNIAPDFEIKNIINYSSESIKLSSLRGKLVIFDFFEKDCGSCIKFLPKLNDLQKKFAGKIQVITVTKLNTKDEILKQLNHVLTKYNLQLPIVIHDKLLYKFFPFEIVSHIVWIGGDGIVKAITSTDYVTERNIKAVLDNEPINWPVKKDILDLDYSQPFISFFKESSPVQPKVVYNSMITGYLDGVVSTDKVIIDSTGGVISHTHFNKSLLELCGASVIASGGNEIDAKRLILEVKNPNRFIYQPDSVDQVIWNRNNKYCYTFSLPLQTRRDEMPEFIKQDLTRWLYLMGITVKQEKRSVACLVLVRTNTDDKLLATKGGKSEYALNDPGNIKKLINSSFSGLIWQLNRNTTGIPWVVDETGIAPAFKVDIQLNIESFRDINILRKELKKYGLDLVNAQRELDMYVITEK